MKEADDISEVERITLPTEAVEYVKDRLSRGYIFSNLLLENVEWTQGEVITYLPKGSPSELYVDPDSGHSGEHPGRMWNYFYSHVAEFLDRNDEFVAIFEDSVSRMGDPKHELGPGHKVFFEDRRYLFCTEPDPRKVEIAFENAESACILNGAVCHLPEKVRLESGGTISDDELAALSRYAHLVVISAYDGCAYVMWERNAP